MRISYTKYNNSPGATFVSVCGAILMYLIILLGAAVGFALLVEVGIVEGIVVFVLFCAGGGALRGVCEYLAKKMKQAAYKRKAQKKETPKVGPVPQNTYPGENMLSSGRENVVKPTGDNSAVMHLPGFLLKPAGALAELMYGGIKREISQKKCGYSIEINESYQNASPRIVPGSDNFACNETHIYSKENVSFWYVVTTMKTPQVKETKVENFFLQQFNLARSLGIPSLIISMPEKESIREYQSLALHDLGSYPDYERLKGLDDSHIFCHAVWLNGKVYKDYVLCARKGDYAWKLECFIVSQENNAEVSNVDFPPVGAFFGSFRPLV